MFRVKSKKKKIKEFNKNQCPNCGEILNKGEVFCYACNSFITCDGKELLSPDKVSDQDIQRLLDQSCEDEEKNKQTIRGKISSFISALIVITYALLFVFALFSNLKYEVICIVLSLVLFILHVIITPRDTKKQLNSKEIEEIVTKYIAALECKNIYGSEASFEPKSALSEDLILRASFYGPFYEKYQGNRLIQGSWKGYPFNAGHVKLMNFHSHNGHRNTIDIFDGYCMSIDTDLIFPEKISIIEKYMGCLTQIIKENKDESDLFYDVFKVKSDHKEILEKFLTPELRKNIILVSRKYAGNLNIVLSPDGNIFIAAGGGENAFAEDMSAEKRRVEYRKELEFPLKVLECFSCVDTVR